MSGLKEPEELEPAQGSLRLASADDTATRADWEAATAAVLRKTGKLAEGEPDSAVWDKLTRSTLDGIRVAPIGTPEQVADLATAGRPTRTDDWDIRVHVVGPDAKSANEAVLVDLENGATSLWIELGSGLSAADLPTVLDGVLLDLAPVVLDGGGPAAAAALLDLATDRGVDLHPATNLGAGPLGDDLLIITTLARQAGVRGVVVDAARVHDRGASDAQELGFSIASGVHVLRVLTEAGLTVNEAARLVEFRYAASDEQFPTIAKLRAARRLWARVLGLSGATAEAGEQRQHAVTSRAMMTKYDPWVNMLRGTVAAFAAGVGGAESVTVVPFDEPLGLPDAFGRRIARNTSSLLISESHLAKVVDPAGGAYAVERLTDDLAAAGWAELGRIEESGGLAAALADGSFDARVDAVVAERDKQVALRRRPITGLSEFPNLQEQLPARAVAPGSAASRTVRRYGAAFEALRDEPATSPVFLATLGPIAAHTARATFASNLLAAGGIAVDVAGATDGVDALLAAYGGQKVVCLAGTDAAYAEWGAAAAAALRDAGARHVVIAGKATEWVDDSCARGVDALAFLTRTREELAR